MGQSLNSKVALAAKLKKIEDIAKKFGIYPKYLKKFGDFTAKISADELFASLKKRKNGKLVLVTSITPTHLGEGKTVNTIGLSMALNKLGKKSWS